MPQPGEPRILSAFVLLTLAISVGAFAIATDARSQQSDIGAAKKSPSFSHLAVRPSAMGFKKLVFPFGQASETGSFTISNIGKGTTSLTATVGNPTGPGAAAFKILSGAGTLPSLAPGTSAIVTVEFQPVKDGSFAANIEVATDATKGPKNHSVHLEGSAKGSIPSPTASATATATATPTAAPTPAPVSTDKNSANAPGVIISGTTVTVTVPLGSDDNDTHGAMQVVVEAAASPLPSPSLIATDRVNSCTPSSSREVVCSGQGGSADLIPAGGGAPTILPLSNLMSPTSTIPPVIARDVARWSTISSLLPWRSFRAASATFR